MAFDLEFERPLAEIDKRIQALHRRGEKLRPEDRAHLREAELELDRRTREIYASLNPWQRVLVARHRERPYTADYIKFMCDDFFELHGDRRFGDDKAIIGGIASLDGKTVMLLGN
ncbi:MAG: acetyl-CoA carboxylase carboxyl transferase subunit alpha, partial [Ktedonobacterales bacterium]